MATNLLGSGDEDDASSVDTAILKDRIIGRIKTGLSGTKRKINTAFSSDSDDSFLDTINRRPSEQQNLPRTKQSALFHSSSEDSDNDVSIKEKIKKVVDVQSKEGEMDVESCDGADEESSVDTATLMNRIKNGNGTKSGSIESIIPIERQKSDSSLDSSSSLLRPKLTNRWVPTESAESQPSRSNENKSPNNHAKEMESESVIHDDLSVVDDDASVDTVELTRRISNARRTGQESPEVKFVLPDQSSSSEEEDSIGGSQELQEPLQDYSQRQPPMGTTETTLVADLPPENEQPPPKGIAVENPYLRKAHVPVSSQINPPRQDSSQTPSQPHTPVVFHDGLRKPQARFSSPKRAPIKTPTGELDDIQNSDDDGEAFGFGRTVTAAIERRKRDSILVNTWNEQSDGPPLNDRFSPGAYQTSEAKNREEYGTPAFPTVLQANLHQNNTPRAEANKWSDGFGHHDNDFVLTGAAYDKNDHQRAPQPLISSPQRQHPPETSNPNRFGSFAKSDRNDSYRLTAPGTEAFDRQMEMNSGYAERIPNPLAYSGGDPPAYNDDTKEYHDFELSSSTWEQPQPFAPQHPVELPAQPFLNHNGPSFSREQGDQFQHHDEAQPYFHHNNSREQVGQQYDAAQPFLHPNNPSFSRQQEGEFQQHHAPQPFLHPNNPREHEGQFQRYDAGGYSTNEQIVAEQKALGETHSVHDFTLDSSAHSELDFDRFQKAPMPAQQRAPRIRDAKSRKKIPRARGRKGAKQRNRKKKGGFSAKRRPAGKGPALAVHGDDPNLSGVGGAEITF